ncbi:MAG TPA: TMEM43 family protein [Spirochaetota bacterium]|nr:TMEM43 family protein [Spirochaetota bacterium]HNT10667.1 TMEM43 family protein [Spirochaetota bacterium]
MALDHYELTDLPVGDDEDYDSSDSSDSDDLESGTTVQGAGSQFVDSVKGMLVGVLLFLASFVILFKFASCGEKGKMAGKAVPIEQAQENGFAYVSGVPVVDEIGDGATLQKGKYIRINKNVEYYAVVTSEKSSTKKEGTKKITEKWHEYSLEWTSSPKPIKLQYKKDKRKWEQFASQNGLPMDYRSVNNPVVASGEKTSETINTTKLEVSGYTIPAQSVAFKDGSKDIGIVNVKGDKDKAKVGDKRIRYSAYPADTQFTFLGDKKGKTLMTHAFGNRGASIEASTGDINKLIGDLKSEDSMIWWAGLIIGFICMAAGLNGMVGPLTTLLDFIPYVGEFGAGAIRFVLTLVAAIISIVFYLLVYYWWIVLIIVAGVVGFLIYRKKMAKPAAA